MPPGDLTWIPSPLDTDIFLMSENVLDDRRRSANAINPCTESFRRSRSTGPLGGASTGSESDDLLLLFIGSSNSFSSVIVGVNWFLDLSSGVLTISSDGDLGLSIGSDIETILLLTDSESGFESFSVILVRSSDDF